MKKHHTNKQAFVTWHGAYYAIPLHVLEKYKINQNPDVNDVESIETVFEDLVGKYGEPAVILRGLRTREGLSQVDFANAIGVTQQNLSAMENGRRSIGKELAKRIAKKFKINYRLLL